MKIANAPCSWGVLEFGLNGRSPNYRQVLDEMRISGYDGTELGDWGFMPTDPERLRAALGERHLSLAGAFVPVAFADRSRRDDGKKRALTVARLLAETSGGNVPLVLADANGTVPHRTNNAGRIRPEHGLSDQEWGVFADGVHEVAEAIRQQSGLPVAFHHHCGGFVETPSEIEELLVRTDPALIGLCFDTGHYEYGGGTATEGVERFGDRIVHVHFKDCDRDVARRARAEEWDYFQALRNGVFTELGRGSVDFRSVLSALKEIGYAGWIVVEQDILPGSTTPPLESARRNREYLARIGL